MPFTYLSTLRSTTRSAACGPAERARAKPRNSPKPSTSDRAAFIKQYFGVEWPGRHRFHLMINSKIGEQAAVETILDAVNVLDKRHAKTAPLAQPSTTH